MYSPPEGSLKTLLRLLSGAIKFSTRFSTMAKLLLAPAIKFRIGGTCEIILPKLNSILIYMLKYDSPYPAFDERFRRLISRLTSVFWAINVQIWQ